MAKANPKSRRGKGAQHHKRVPRAGDRPEELPSRPTSVVGWLPLLLVITSVLVYGNSLSGPFILDDFNAIVDNEHIRQVWPLWDALSAPAQTPVAGRPIVSLTLAVNHAFGGLQVQGYHVLNVLVHVLCALAVFGIIRRTLLGDRLRERFGRGANGTALACTLIWMVHPVQTEAVNYITQRTESIMGLFYLLTVYAAIRAGDSGRRDRWAWTSVLCCALGMASKEVMVTAPAMVLLYDRTFRFGSFQAALGTRWRLYVALAATWGILLALMWSGPRANTVGFSTEVGAWTYALNQCQVIVEYVWLSLWPHPLIVYYGEPQSLSVAEVAPSLVIVGGLLVGTAVALVSRPMLGFLGAWFFVILMPTSSFIPIATEVAAERRVYLPLAGLVVLGVIAVRVLVERGVARRRGAERRTRGPIVGLVKQWASPVLMVAVVASLGLSTVRRNEDYRSRVSLWRSVVDWQPDNWTAQNNLGVALREEDRVDEAIIHFRQSLEVNPDSFDANYNLGNEVLLQGRVEEATGFLRRALEAESRHELAPQAHNTLGMSLASLDRLDQAVTHYRQALGMNPDFAEAYYNLGNALRLQGNLEQAISHYRHALNLNPDYAEAHHNLGEALAVSGEFDEALRHFREAVRVKPDLAVTWSRMAEILGGHPDAEVRDPGQAVRFAERAAELTGYENPAILLTLAEMYGAAGQFSEAVETARTALAVLEELASTSESNELSQYLRERLAVYRAYEQVPPRR